MIKRSLLVVTVAAVVIVPLAAQSKYKVPRTPWGDPDLQGNYTNLYENGTPLERPDEFAGRSLDDVKGDELAAIKRATQERTINAFQGPIHAPDNWWQDALNLDQGQPGVADRRSAGRPDSRR